MAPVDTSPINLAKHPNFELVASSRANDLIPVRKFRSTRSGLTLILAEVDGPVVNGYFCLDTDHTCYTMTTVGSEGFLSLMPIYLDHILFPTLTDAGFMTEVHHITGEGEDGGVVRAYHKEFYRPENLTLIVTGKVSFEEVFAALDPLEEKLAARGERDSFQRPWQTLVPSLPAAIDKEVPYPSDEEENGMVYIAWRGPSAVTDLYSMGACSVLLKYLTDTAVSPLQREFVEIKDPYASKVCYSLIENSISALYIIFENVPVNKLDKVKGHLDQVLSSILSEKEPIDLVRLRTVINRQILESLSHLETNPHDTVAFMVIGDMLYGHSKSDLDQRLNSVRDLRRMLEEPIAFWIELLGKFLGPAVPSVMTRGRPSAELQQKMAEEEEKRVEMQRNTLGKDGLAKKEAHLRAAMENNEKPPPSEMLTSVPIPSISGINFHSIESFSSAQPEVSHPAFPDLTKAGVMMHVDNLRTNFVYMFALLDTSELNDEERPYLPLLLETLLESSVQRGDQLLPYEAVVAELEADTVNVSTRIGLEPVSRFSCGPFCQTAVLYLQLEPGKYSKGVQWLHELLFHTRLTAERLQLVAAKMANDVAQAKRQGNKVAGALLKGMLYKKESNQYCSSMIRQYSVLTELMAALEAGGEQAQQMMERIEKLRTHLTEPSRMVLHVCANFDTLEEPTLPWLSFLPPTVQPAISPLKVTPDWSLLQSDSGDRACVLGLGCVESAFLRHCCPGLQGFMHDDLAPLLVFLQYLTQLEGPMWKQVRGQGLAYSYNMFPEPNEGMLYFTLYRATNVVAAFNESKSVVECQLKKDAVWETSLLESARSSLVYEVVEREKSVGDVVAQSLLSYFKKVSHDYNKEMVRRIFAVTAEDLKRVGPKYITPLFTPGSGYTSIVCHPSKVEEVAAAFNQLGYPMKISPNLEGSPLGC
ncbi:hypothetical protein B566_EDAN005966 [Ephemera danica]|nr:hypothetical protein B566_EDAN005966 [Ephemera danica]